VVEQSHGWYDRDAVRQRSIFLQQTDGSSTFHKAAISRPEPTENGPRLSFARAYSLSLSPYLIYSRSALLPLLVSSQVYRQLEFLAVGSFWVYKPPSSESDSTAAVTASLIKVPSSREDVFSNKSLDLSARRKLIKFLHFIVDYENQQEQWGSYRSRSFADFLIEHFKIPTHLHGPVLALTLSPDNSTHMVTSDALLRISRHLRSIGVFGRGFAAVIPKWGGLSEIAQVGCRAGAVGGGVYVLGKGLREVSPTPQIGDERTEVGYAGIPSMSAVLSDDEKITANWILGCEDDLGAAANTAHQESPDNAEEASATRCICVVSSPLTQLFPVLAEGASEPAGAVIAFPSGSLSLPSYDEDMELLPVHIMAHSSDTGECPAGQCKLHPYQPLLYLPNDEPT